MAFVFEKKRTSQGKCATGSVEFAAIRITVHKEGKGTKGWGRFYIAMNPKAVKLGRFLKGDRLTIGFDVESGMLAVRRDNENGFAVSGGAFNGHRGNAAFQVAIDPAAEIAKAIFRILGEWIPAKEDDGMLLIDSYSLRGSQNRLDTPTSGG